MSHPKNRRERFIIGYCKGIKRAKNYCNGFLFKNDSERREALLKNSRSKRNTTKLCSCSMCGNPRRVNWKNKLTIQEKKFYSSLE